MHRWVSVWRQHGVHVFHDKERTPKAVPTAIYISVLCCQGTLVMAQYFLCRGRGRFSLTFLSHFVFSCWDLRSLARTDVVSGDALGAFKSEGCNPSEDRGVPYQAFVCFRGSHVQSKVLGALVLPLGSRLWRVLACLGEELARSRFLVHLTKAFADCHLRAGPLGVQHAELHGEQLAWSRHASASVGMSCVSWLGLSRLQAGSCRPYFHMNDPQ